MLPAHVVARAVKPTQYDISNADMLALCRALDPKRVSYGMNYSALRIASQICVAEPDKLSAKQRNAAIRIGLRFRRQLPPDIVATLASARSAA